MVTDELKALADLLAKATPGDLSTAERHTLQEAVECPFCQGQGEVEAADYCNFDGVALGVQFYGIGEQFGAHEALWNASVNFLRDNLPAIIEQRAEIERMKVVVEAMADFDGRNNNEALKEMARTALANIGCTNEQG